MDIECEAHEFTSVTFEWKLKGLKALFEATKGDLKSKASRSGKFDNGKWQVSQRCYVWVHENTINPPRFSSTRMLVFQEIKILLRDVLVFTCPVMCVVACYSLGWEVHEDEKPTPQEKEAGMSDSGRYVNP